MDFKALKQKLKEGIDSAKENLPQIDTDALKQQLDEKLNSAKMAAADLSNKIDTDALKQQFDEKLNCVKTAAADLSNKIDTDALKQQFDEKLNNAKNDIKVKAREKAESAKQTINQAATDFGNKASELKDNATELKTKAAKGISQGINDLKEKADKAAESIGKAYDKASADAKTALESCGKNMDEFKANVIDNIGEYAKQFSENDLWTKLRGFAAKAGAKLVYIVLCLFYALDTISIKEKLIVMGALGYFIFPTDAIPDIMPGIGFSDDLAALLAVFNGLRSGIKPESVGHAQDKLTEWFGEIDQADLPDVNGFTENQLATAVGVVSDVKKDGATKTAKKLLKKQIDKSNH